MILGGRGVCLYGFGRSRDCVRSFGSGGLLPAVGSAVPASGVAVSDFGFLAVGATRSGNLSPRFFVGLRGGWSAGRARLEFAVRIFSGRGSVSSSGVSVFESSMPEPKIPAGQELLSAIWCSRFNGALLWRERILQEPPIPVPPALQVSRPGCREPAFPEVERQARETAFKTGEFKVPIVGLRGTAGGSALEAWCRAAGVSLSALRFQIGAEFAFTGFCIAEIASGASGWAAWKVLRLNRNSPPDKNFLSAVWSFHADGAILWRERVPQEPPDSSAVRAAGEELPILG